MVIMYENGVRCSLGDKCMVNNLYPTAMEKDRGVGLTQQEVCYKYYLLIPPET